MFAGWGVSFEPPYHGGGGGRSRKRAPVTEP